MVEAILTANDSVNSLPLAATAVSVAQSDGDDELRKEKPILTPVRGPPRSLTMQVTPATISTALSSSMSMSSPVDSSVVADRSTSSSRHSTILRLPLPSPSRPRLDPRYAARLAPSTRAMLATRSSESDLRLSPGLQRDPDSSIFRPTPIITCDAPDDGGCSPMDLSLEDPSSTPYILNGSQFFGQNLVFSRSESVDSSMMTPDRASVTTTTTSSSDIGVSDRFIPSRATSTFHFNMWRAMSPRTISGSEATQVASSNGSPSDGNPAQEDQDDSDELASNPTTTAAPSQQNILNSLLRSELLRENDVPASYSSMWHAQPHSAHSPLTSTPLREGGSNLRYQSPRQVFQDNIFEEAVGPTAVVNSFSLMPLASASSHRLLTAPAKRKRRISKVPFKVLDAPALQDDFYLHLVDWSSQNVLAVGLGSCVYLWSACTSKVTKLCDLASSEDLVTSVSWAQRGTHLAVGTNRGEVQLWDTIKCKRVRTMPGHNARVGVLAWSGPTLASGSRDRLIYLRDVRSQSAFVHQLTNHKQEVCGLKWSFDEPAFLASGGNDNNLHVIDSRNPNAPIHQFTEHTAAVKAIAWSPHQHGLLASGGGTADRCIRFFNTISGVTLSKIDTGSQVCNLAWSHNVNEIVSTHGYSLNQIVVWRYPSMTKVATLTGHTYRVLYLSVSPDGSTIVTGAGDETLRFWQVFPGPRSDGKESSGGLLFPQTLGSVVR